MEHLTTDLAWEVINIGTRKHEISVDS